jgi:hypothetical protein
MKLVGFITLVAVAVAIVATTVAGAAPTATKPTANAALLEFEGTVVSVNRATRTFRLRDSERGTVRIKVTRNTRFERINGLRGLRAGMRNIESVVRRSNGARVAVAVERSGGGGAHGGDHDRGGDDS